MPVCMCARARVCVWPAQNSHGRVHVCARARPLRSCTHFFNFSEETGCARFLCRENSHFFLITVYSRTREIQSKFALRSQIEENQSSTSIKRKKHHDRQFTARAVRRVGR